MPCPPVAAWKSAASRSICSVNVRGPVDSRHAPGRASSTPVRVDAARNSGTSAAAFVFICALSRSHSAMAAAAFARVSGLTSLPPAAHFLHWDTAVAMACDSVMPRSRIRSLAMCCMNAGSCMPLRCQRPWLVWPTFSCPTPAADSASVMAGHLSPRRDSTKVTVG
jgi:hypothetical protein